MTYIEKVRRRVSEPIRQECWLNIKCRISMQYSIKLIRLFLYPILFLFILPTYGQDTLIARKWWILGVNAMKRDQFDSSATYFQFASRNYLSIAQRMIRDEALPFYQRYLNSSLRMIGAQILTGKIEKPESLYLPWIDEARQLLGDSSAVLVWGLFQFGNSEFDRDKYYDAEKIWLQALSISNASYGKSSFIGALLNQRLANLYSVNNSLHRPDYDKALTAFNRALDIYKQLEGTRARIGEANVYNSIGSIHHMLKSLPEALRAHLNSLAILEEIGASASEEISFTCSYISLIYTEMGDHQSAAEYAKRGRF